MCGRRRVRFQWTSPDQRFNQIFMATSSRVAVLNLPSEEWLIEEGPIPKRRARIGIQVVRRRAGYLRRRDVGRVSASLDGDKDPLRPRDHRNF